MRDHVTDVKTSKRLRDAGVDKKSIYTWFVTGAGKIEVLDYSWHLRTEDALTYPAYLLSELLEMVEGGWKNLEYCISSCSKWWWEFDCRNKEMEAAVFVNASPIQAVADAIIWQRENAKLDREAIVGFFNGEGLGE